MSDWAYTNAALLLDYDCALLISYDVDIRYRTVEKAREALPMLQAEVLRRMGGGGNVAETEWYSEITNRVAVSFDRPK